MLLGSDGLTTLQTKCFLLLSTDRASTVEQGHILCVYGPQPQHGELVKTILL